MADYLRGVTQQAEDRDEGAIRDVGPYMEIRRRDSAVGVSFFPGELHLSIPDEAYYHPVMKELRDGSIDLVVLDNVSGVLPTPLCVYLHLSSCM